MVRLSVILLVAIVAACAVAGAIASAPPCVQGNCPGYALPVQGGLLDLWRKPAPKPVTPPVVEEPTVYPAPTPPACGPVTDQTATKSGEVSKGMGHRVAAVGRGTAKVGRAVLRAPLRLLCFRRRR